MSWTRRVNKPEELLTVGETVPVKIKELSPERRRISLSLRDAEGDPWSQVAERFPVGSEVTGTVESKAQFGLFVTLLPGVTGLLPAGVIKSSPQAGALNKLDKGDSVTLMVQSVDVAARRISLAPEGSAPVEDASWKKHVPSSSPALGNLGRRFRPRCGTESRGAARRIL